MTEPFDDVVTCDTCGQRNRLPATLPDGKVAICGRCKGRLDDVADDDDDDDDQE